MLALSRPLRVTFIFLPCYVIICSGQEQASRGNTPRFASTILLICWSPRTDTLVNNLLAYIITTGETCPASSIPDRSNRRVPRPTYIVRTFLSSRATSCLGLHPAIFISVDAVLGIIFVR